MRYPRVIRDDTVKNMYPLERIAALCTRSEFQVHVKFFIIRPFTMIRSGPFPMFPAKNTRLHIYPVQRRILLLCLLLDA